MKKKNYNFLKKRLAKLVRLFGVELVDQYNFTFLSNNKYLTEGLDIKNRSISIPFGELKIERKVNSILIILRTCTSELLMDQKKDRVFGKEKKEYTFRTLNSLKKNINFLKKKLPNIYTEILITDTNSSDEDINNMKQKLENIECKSNLIKINVEKHKNRVTGSGGYSNAKISNMANFHESINIAEKSNSDLVFFLEDDYILRENCLVEMIKSYEKFSTLLKNEIILLPADYPYLYEKNSLTEIFFGIENHWRKVDESLVTFMTSAKLIKKYVSELLKMTKEWEDPWETTLYEIYKKNYCLSPIPSLAMHCANINSRYGIPPSFNWIEEWEKNND